ncbi:MAG: DNA topoisomerase [Gemmataceae bacterium]|nr:DNA topoisomerase [Gemmataceae bacterium]
MAARKKKNLVIVESPAKAKTINKYLGPDYEVVACKGHIRDLPKSKFGIDIEQGWVPTYTLVTEKDKQRDKDKKELVKRLKQEAGKADLVYLAPDPDREGEAIAWHLKEVLGLDDQKFRRVTFNEITKSAVQKAFTQARDIDMDLVGAQEARRFLDRVVGYKLSPLLSNTLAQTLSAGRVQSVAVRLIVEREREIQAFKPEEYWRITALLAPQGTVSKTALSKSKPEKKPAAKSAARGKGATKKGEKPAPEQVGAASRAAPVRLGSPDLQTDGQNGQQETAAPEIPEGSFLAELAEWAGQKFKASREDEAMKIFNALEGAAYVVSKVEQKDQQEKPKPPFITSSLQQQASIRLRFSPKKTMALAQRLYEGVDLSGEGSIALITYMRTDSTRIADEALNACRDLIQQKYGAPYLPAQPNRYASGKSAQEAHEAIRPTDLVYTPQRVEQLLPAGAKDRHDLIRLYTLIYNRFVASQMTPAIFAVTNVDVSAAEGIFKARGKILKFDGYRRVLPPGGKQEDVLLPPLQEKQPLDLLKLTPTQHFTEPPPRYNEASLIDTLKKEGIGRPSTYVSIIEKIKERGYVELKERRFYATEIGMRVTDLLVAHFPDVMNLKFTSHIEEDLDRIEGGKFKRNDALNEFYGPFAKALEVAEGTLHKDAEKCPKCGKPLKERFGKFGKFFGCSGYPDCDYIKKRGGEEKEPPKPTEHKCPECGAQMLERMGPRGPFLGCSTYPKCKTTMNLDAEGKPVPTATKTKHVCEKCGQPMVLREGRRGPFLACTGYPKCKNAKDVDAEGNPVKPIETGLECDKCGSPMVVKRGPRGPFAGCSNYPSCKRTRPIPEELKEKVQALMPPKKKAPKVEVSETCPDCEGPMEVRQSRRGPFLGCSNYPKCKGTREISPDLRAELQAGSAT